MMKQYFHTRLRLKSTYVIAVLLLQYAILPCINFNYFNGLALPLNKNPSFFQVNFIATFYDRSMSIFLLPIYLYLMWQNHSFFSRYYILYRFSSYENYWKNRLLTAAVETTAFLLYLYLLMFLRALYFGKSWEFLAGAQNLLLCFLLQLVGFLLIAEIFHFLDFISHSVVCAFLVAFSIGMYDYIARYFLLIPDGFFLRCVSRNMDPMNLSGYWPTLFIFTVILVFFYFIIPTVSCLNDRLPKEAGA